MNKIKVLNNIRFVLLGLCVITILMSIIISCVYYKSLWMMIPVLSCIIAVNTTFYLFDTFYFIYRARQLRIWSLINCLFFLSLSISLLCVFYVGMNEAHIGGSRVVLFFIVAPFVSLFPFLYFFFDWLILKLSHTKLLTAEELEEKAKEKEPEKLKKKRLKKIKRIKKWVLRKATDFKTPTPTSLASIKNWFVPKITTEEIVNEALKQLVDEDMITILDDNHYQATELAYKYKAKKTYGWLLTTGICCIIVGASNFSRFKDMVNVVVGILFIVVGITIMVVAYIMRPKD